MKLSYWYRQSKHTPLITVYITYSHAALPTLRIPTTIRIDPINPDPTQDAMIQAEGNRIEKIVNDFWFQHDHKYPTPAELKTLLDENAPATDNVISVYKNWLSRQTFTYHGIHNQIIDSIKHLYPNLTLQEITHANLDKLKLYWVSTNKSDETTKKRFSTLKYFLKRQSMTTPKPNPEFATYDHGLSNTPASRIRQEIFILTKEEHDILLKHKFSNPNRQYAVNLYLLSCATALRIVDVIKVTKDSVVDDNGILRVMVPIDKLGGELSRCPLNDISREIIYNRDLSIELTEPHIRMNLAKAFNEILPKMPKSFSKICTFYHKNGGTAIPIKKPKYDFLEFHSSRRYFASYYSSIVGRELTMYWGSWGTNSSSFDKSYQKKDFDEKEQLKKF